MAFNDDIRKELDNELILEDEEGNEGKFELLDALEYEGKKYIVCSPEDCLGEVLFMEVQGSAKEQELFCIGDDDLEEILFEIFKERNKELFDEED